MPQARLDDKGQLWFVHICEHGSTDVAMLPATDFIVEDAEPLSVYPAMSCTDCGIRGWFRHGVWAEKYRVLPPKE